MRKQIWIKTVSSVLAGALLCTSFAGCQKKAVTENQILDQELNGTEYVQQEYSTIAESAKKIIPASESDLLPTVLIVSSIFNFSTVFFAMFICLQFVFKLL